MTIVERVAAVLDAEFDGNGKSGSMLAAASGGADSNVLLYCLHEYCGLHSINLVACHFNHGLRAPGEHAADLALVRHTCDHLEIPLVTDSAEPGAVRALASDEGSGIEAAARSLRYRFFTRAADAIGAGWICTGHTEDDQVETVLMALERGVDALALCGIPERRLLREDLILLRPLLSVRRQQVEEFLREHDASWREDPTNAETVYERNRIRHEVLPRLEDTLPGFRDTILALRRNAERLRRVAQEESRSLSWVIAGDDSSLDAGAFFRASREARLLSLFGEARRRGLFKPSSRISVRFFAPLLGSRPAAGTIVRGRGSHIQREGERLLWSTDIVRSTEYGYLRSVTPGVALELPNGPTVTAYTGEKETTGEQPGVIELKQVHEPLVIRSHRVGDEIQTGGGHKSVASLLAEQRVPRRQRHLVPVVCDREGVVAVLAHGFGQGRSVVACRAESGGMLCTLVIGGVNIDG